MKGIEDVDKKQVENAVAALLKYIGKEKKDSANILEEDELLYLVRGSSETWILIASVPKHEILNAGIQFLRIFGLK